MNFKRMLSKLFSFLILAALFLVQMKESSVFAQDDLPPATPSPAPAEPTFPLPDDIMISNHGDTESGLALNESSAVSYSVLPIMFVPADLTPNPNGLRYIDQRMQLVQRWYAEQLRGRTFTLQPAILIRGSQPLSSYYGNCFPPDDCGWGYELWDHIFADLSSMGYPNQSDLIHGVFFQHDGMGAPALGGGHDFLVALDADNNRPNADCLEPGCASSVAKGGAAHELGHAVGLPHTSDDPEGSPGVSLMNYGFYNFPQATLVNTSINPERNMLYASPFMNIQMGLADQGFEDCLASWSVISGTANCSSITKKSGLKALTLSPTSGSNVQVQQQIPASQRTYDLSAWINSPDTGNHHVWIQIAALSANAQVLSSQIFGDSVGATDGWQRIAYSFSAPAQTTSLRLMIHASGSTSTTIYVDDVDVHETLLVPPIPLQMFYFDGDTVNGNSPILRWDDVTGSTSYQVQIGVNSSFNSPIWNLSVTSPSFPVPSGLSLGSRYFWRVRAVNGTGTSGWSDIWSFVTASPQNYFSDEFENMGLAGSWSWIREDQAHWHFGGPANRRWTGYMGITAQEGDLLGANNSAKNLLLKTPPPGDYEISTKIDFWEPGPSINYQQAGLLIYQDDNNYLKLMRTYNNGNKLEWLAEINGVVVQNTTRPIGANPPIRITKSGNQYSGRYSVDGITWQTLGSPVTVNLNNPKIGLAAFSRLNVQQINAYFDYFRVTSQLTISGTTGIGGTTLSYNDGINKTVTADGSGNYSISVPPGWSGTVTPSQTCYTFNPPNRSYSNLNANQSAQNYTATFNSSSGCADIDVLIAGNNMGSYVLPAGNSLRQGYAGVDNGPAKVVSANSVDILSALRVIWKEPGPRYSYSEMMGLPKEQLSTEYWFPWYNNTDTASMDQGFRIANVDTTPHTIRVFVGPTQIGSDIILNGGGSARVGYDVNNGPVRIVCTDCTNPDDKIIAALRVIWKEPGFRASYSEMMGLPKEQLSNEYWFPWYNNAVPASMDQGFRIANVSTIEENTVEVRLGNTLLDTITLGMGSSVRVAYNVDNGPIKIVCTSCTNTGTDKIIAALRVIWKEPGFRASYSEMMGLPVEQLSSQYWFPWYNNAVPASMDQGFRIANVSTTESNTIEVWVGSTKLATIPLGMGGSTRVGYNLDNGPIRIVCTTCTNTGSDKILAALRVIWREPGFRASYSEMMGLPHEALSTEYWFPWYNFAAPNSMDQGFRIAVP